MATGLRNGPKAGYTWMADVYPIAMLPVSPVRIR